MPRFLVALLALLSLTPAARSDTPPSPTDVVHATLFNQAPITKYVRWPFAPDGEIQETTPTARR